MLREVIITTIADDLLKLAITVSLRAKIVMEVFLYEKCLLSSRRCHERRMSRPDMLHT